MPYRYCIEFFIITIIFCLVIDCIGRNPSKLWAWDRYGYLLIFSILFTIIIERLYFCCKGRPMNTIFSVLAITFSVLSIAILINLITKLTTVFGIESNIIGIIQTLLIIIPGLLAIIAGEGVLTKTGKGVIDGIIKSVNIPQERRYITYLLFSMSSFIISVWSLYIIPQNLKYFYMKKGDEAYCLKKSGDCYPKLDRAEDAYLKMIKIDPSNSIRLPNNVDLCKCLQQSDKCEDNGANVTSLDNNNVDLCKSSQQSDKCEDNGANVTSLDNNKAYYYLGEIYRELREFEKSRRHYKIAYKSGCNQALDGIALSYLSEKGDKEFSLAADTFSKATEDSKATENLTSDQYKILFALVENHLFNEKRKSYSEAERWLNLGQEYNPIDELTEILDSTNKKISYLKIDKNIDKLFDCLITIENYYKIYLYYTKLNLKTEKYDSEFFQYLSTTFKINIFFNNSLKQLEEKLNSLEEKQGNNENRKIEQANKNIKDIRNFIKELVNEKGAYETRADVVGIWRSKYNKDVFNIFVKHKDEFSNIPSTENYPYIDQYRQNQIENYKKLIRKTIIDNKLELFENVKKTLLSNEYEKNKPILEDLEDTEQIVLNIQNKLRDSNLNDPETLNSIIQSDLPKIESVIEKINKNVIEAALIN